MNNTDDVILLKVDFAFQYVMRNKTILGALIADVLGYDREDITCIQPMQKDLEKEHVDDKLGILDVYVTIREKTRINIELQVRSFEFWVNRSLFYTCKMYTEQVKAGTIYDEIHPCVSISILDFTLFDDVEQFHSRYRLMNEETGKIYTDKIEFHTIELTKLKNAGEEEQKSDLYKWAKMFQASTWEEYKQIGKEDEVMGEVVRELEKINQDEEARLDYLHRQMAIMDKKQELKDARRHGIEEGISQGITQGKKEGIELGVKAMIEALRELNLSDETIIEKLKEKFALSQKEAEKYLE
ncbi:Rpn family recombination-promoting nuclease/putative transposase [Konateibacter massiliensis]|uniref:Rpn family recombination-promoting nuclease/putative transposase n=1 Tax=Konateibacter massiliensis TaxID=2002841 RepID=UPI000C15137C|nr:Rpn family recombination-promoting nuclease/putative transposase [Konateibacter massiliensis]